MAAPTITVVTATDRTTPALPVANESLECDLWSNLGPRHWLSQSLKTTLICGKLSNLSGTLVREANWNDDGSSFQRSPRLFMKSQIKIGKIFGVEIGLHYSWFVIAGLIAFSLAVHFHEVNPYWTSGVIWLASVITAVLFFAALILHELSHAMVAKLRGLPIHEITLFMLGGAAQIEREPSDANTEFWMAIVGPITSLGIGFGLLGIAEATGWSANVTPPTPGLAILVWLGYINILLGVFNFIPGFPLDGGRVLRAIVWWIVKDGTRATKIAVRVGQVVAVLFVLFGIFEFFYGLFVSGLWMVLIGWFLMQAAKATLVQTEVTALLRNILVRDLMTSEWMGVSPNAPVQDVVHESFRTGRRIFLVVDEGHLVGMVTPAEARKVESALWPQTTVREIMLPIDKIKTVAPEMPALRALEILGRENLSQLPVVSDGNLRGIVSRAHLLDVLQARSELHVPPEVHRAA